MTVKILIFIGVVLLLLLTSFLAKKYVNRYSKYSFQNWEKSDLPFIYITVHGKVLNMLADSAAAVSIIRKEALKDLSYKKSNRKVNLIALTGDDPGSDVVTLPVNIGEKIIECDFVVYDGGEIGYAVNTGVTIDGVLGVEFFRQTNGIVDFKNKIVKFP